MPEILFEHPDYVICVKPIGLDSEEAMPQSLTASLHAPVFPVHRLDQNVAGIMVYARSRQAAAQFSRLIQDGKLEKEYVAICHGTPPEEGTLTDLLFRDARKNKVYVVNTKRKGVREARLSYRTLSHLNHTTLVLIHLETGRSHQIRIQFASRGYPLVGDHKYGSRDVQPFPMLYACRLTFPWNGKTVCYQSQPDWSGIFPENHL